MLKAKKIGGLEACVDETLTDEVSDEEDMANGDTESMSTEDPPAECLNQNAKVQVFHNNPCRKMKNDRTFPNFPTHLWNSKFIYGVYV